MALLPPSTFPGAIEKTEKGYLKRNSPGVPFLRKFYP